MKHLALMLAISVAALGAGPAGGAQTTIPEPVVSAANSLIPNVRPDSIRPSPIEDLYEVVFGPNLLYLSADGRHLMHGDIVEVASRENLTESHRKEARLAAIERLGEASMVVFAPAVVKHTVTVFTDVDCAYCARLHQEVPQLNRMGVKVRYMAFPRAGLASSTFEKMVSVWCADDSLSAMTDAKFGQRIEPKSCQNPIKEHFTLGRLVGVTGTPTIVLESGELIPGYVPAQRLLRMLERGDDG